MQSLIFVPSSVTDTGRTFSPAEAFVAFDTAARYQDLCGCPGVARSMGRAGCALDDAAAEALNSTVEYVHRHRFRTKAEARLKIATWIADFYDTTRRHSAGDGLPPIT
ncbi:integrase core domain-containing protein [Nonomuraea sp. NPDC000554]|uniref:integrase core domain-containing protein n=1 Tax=Nonomuraea sp. NPDC000554 TaxID=3154259 RepID=UPI003323CF2B